MSGWIQAAMQQNTIVAVEETYLNKVASLIRSRRQCLLKRTANAVQCCAVYIQSTELIRFLSYGGIFLLLMTNVMCPIILLVLGIYHE